MSSYWRSIVTVVLWPYLVAFPRDTRLIEGCSLLEDEKMKMVHLAMCLFTYPAFDRYSFQLAHRGRAQAE